MSWFSPYDFVVGMPGPAYAITIGLVGLALIVLLVVSFKRLQRFRLIEDTPTALVRSAAQGFVELEGSAQAARTPLTSPLRALPCVWWSYSIEEFDTEGAFDREGSGGVAFLITSLFRLVTSRRAGRVVESGTSFECFLIRDVTGACIVDPTHAEVVGANQETWSQGNKRFEECTIAVGQPLYALGQFKTPRDYAAEAEAREVGELDRTWQLDRIKLAERFDANRNGEIDDAEWEVIWQAAKAQVRKRRETEGAEPELHVLCNPEDRRPLLISALPQERLTNRYWFESVLSLLTTVMLVTVMVWLLGARGVT